jgi:hypothetical protein
VRREDAAIYRLYAANCIELAQQILDTDRRLFLLKMAQAWIQLADHVEHNSLVVTTDSGPGAASASGTALSRCAITASSSKCRHCRAETPGCRRRNASTTTGMPLSQAGEGRRHFV